MSGVVMVVWCGDEVASQEPIFIVEAANSMFVSNTTFLERVARTQRRVVRSRAKLSLHRSQPDTSENNRFCFKLSFSASLFKTTWL